TCGMKSHMRMRKVNIYVQHSREQMAEFYNEPRNRFLNSNVDLATQRDVVERLHLAGAEPEGVTYAEVDANAFLSLWCTGEMPQGPGAVAHARQGFRRLGRYTRIERLLGTSQRRSEFEPRC